MRLAEVRRLIAELDLRPSKALGQNFLIDGNILQIILREADVRGDETVVEIGPGLGMLTVELLGRAKHLVAIEKDARLCAHLSRRFPELDLIEGDAIEVALPKCDKVVANLPYSISTPILQRFVEGDVKPRAIIVTLQREVAQRLAAGPRTKDYGALTLFTQLYYHVTVVHVVSPSCFFPAPRVESAIVALNRRDPRVKLMPGAPFHKIVRLGFSQRRKMLGKMLAECGPLDAAIARQRAEELSLEQWITLANALRPASA